MRHPGERAITPKFALGFAVAASLLVIAVMLVALAGRGSSPLTSPIVFSPSDLQTVLGVGALRDDAYVVDALSPRSEALVVRRGEVAGAGDASYLRYRLSGVPRNLEVFFAWRRADQGGALSFTRLPLVQDRDGLVALADHPEWGGSIVEVALYFVPAPQLSPRMPDPLAIKVAGWSLEPATFGSSLSAQLTRWFAFRPWSIMSISSLGYNKDGDVIEGVSLQLLLGGVLVVSMLLIALLFRGARGRRASLAGAVLFCVVLGDLAWTRNLQRVHDLTRATFADTSADERLRALPDGDLAVAIASVATRVDEPQTARVFVHAPTRYLSLRAVWHLLPLNAYERAPADHWIDDLRPDRDYVLVVDDAAAPTQPLSSALALAPVTEAGGVKLFRVVSGKRR